ncbi:hypothetical protein HYQ40_07065 [Aerococcaceae bacterium DSM 111021]|nr:hypothetical protein [Aerococcaceae bacterium DSM 111021]
MKFISYESIKNWKSNNIEDIIDVTDEVPEKIQFAKPIDKEIDWLQFVEVDRYYDEMVNSGEFQELTTTFYLNVMDALEQHFKNKQANLRKFMRRSTGYTFDNNYLFQALFKHLRTQIIHHYRPSYETYSSYDTYLLEQAFGKDDVNVIIGVIETFLAKLPPASPEFQAIFGLTQYGTEQVWWDMDGEYRKQHKMTEAQVNIMQSTTPRSTKPWTGEYKGDIIALYLSYWKIITSNKWVDGPTKSEKRNRFIARIVKRPLNPSSENKYHRFITSLLKLAENTIRQKHKIRAIKIEGDEDNIRRRFRKDVYEEIMTANRLILEEENKLQPKVIRLNREKITDSQADLTTIVDLIGEFVGEEEDSDEEAMEVVSEIVEVMTESTDENSLYTEFIRRLVAETSIDASDAANYCRQNGLLLNAFINDVNQFLYDFIDDQVVINEGDKIVIDEFYVEELQEIVENNFKEK